ncbi:helix-turn-helix domain-containing protein [Cupriavidus sp. CuC1]|uniref:helix-turn-helix domain-containing protein n=1 Tax=Cupriavidus sp. CuC1 TaxID=3373131 RepID=UPI0037D5E2F4
MAATATWSTHGLGQEHITDACAKLPQLHMTWSLSFPEPRRFNASARYRELDRLTIGELRSDRVTGQRAGTSEEPLVGVLMNLGGRLVCRYADRSKVVLEPQHLLIWDSELAYDFEAVEPHREVYLLLPRERVPYGIASAAARPGAAVPARVGSGLSAVAGDQLQAIARELDYLTDTALATACQSFFDMLDSALTVSSGRQSSRASLMIRIEQYIEDNLDDPELSASSIATAHEISVRTLHVAFAETGRTVSRWIRDRRLRVCYRELSRATSTQTVTDVAYRWGFNNAAHFSRTFKQAFGVTPSSLLLDGQPRPTLDNLDGLPHG